MLFVFGFTIIVDNIVKRINRCIMIYHTIVKAISLPKWQLKIRNG